MKLKVILPSGVLMDQEVTKVTAEAENGFFCLLPRHIDFLAALVPGLLSFETESGEEEYLAIDEGVLVKCASEVMISTRHGVRGATLGHLREAVEKQFRILDEREQQSRTILAKLEADLVGRFIRLGEKSCD
ncbi:MAG: F0F1 ATP synthase subunit epsilon [Geobacteraceae bacterium]